MGGNLPNFGTKWQSTPVLLPGKSHGQRSPVGYSPWGCKELDMAERLQSIKVDPTVRCTSDGHGRIRPSQKAHPQHHWAGRQGRQPLSLVNIRACGSSGDFVEHRYVLFSLVPGTVLQAEKTPILHAYSFLYLTKPCFSWTQSSQVCAQADLQAEPWNLAETSRVNVSGSRLHGQQDGVQPLGKTHIAPVLPADFSS